MSLWNKPRERLGKIGESHPKGFLHSDELTEFALPAFWGTDFVEKAIGVLPYGLDATPLIRNAIDRGRYVLLAIRFKKSLVRGELSAWELRATSAGTKSQPKRIPTANWDEVKIDALVYLLVKGTWEHQGQVDRNAPNVSITAFKAEDVERWLDTIQPLFLPPQPEKLSREALTADHITASQAIGWLAGQPPFDDWFNLIEFAAEIRDLHGEIHHLETSGKLGPIHDRACMELATGLAATLCRQSAARKILRLMADGRLAGYGFRESGGEELEQIPTEQFLVPSEFMAYQDRLVPTPGKDDESHRISMTGGRWKYVRFSRAEFLDAFASSPADISSPESNSLEPRISANELPARRPKRNEAIAAINKLIREHGCGPPPKKAAEAEQWLRKEFDFSRDEARNTWSKMTPESWRQRGRPRNIREK